MPSRCTVRRLLLAALVCTALLLGLAGTAPSSVPTATDDGAAEMTVVGTPTVLDSFDDTAAATRPVVVRRSLTVAMLVAVVSLLVALVATSATPASGPPRRAAVARRVRTLRAPPLALPR